MKKLGLIGGTGPESAIEYYRGIEYGVQQRSERGFFPNLTIESLSVFDALDFCERRDYTGRTEYLLKGVRNLAAAGAECAALTGITPHIVFDELAAVSPVPLISMVDTARDHAAECGYKKICLLGTFPTMNGIFFQNSFAKRSIDVVTLNAEEKRYIGTKIETELEFGKILPETQRTFCKIVERILREEKVQAVVLGCTELPLIFRDMELSVPYIDVMQIHIGALIQTILEE